MISPRTLHATRSFLGAALLLCVVMTLAGCDGRVMAAGHAFSLCACFGMFWAVVNMHRFKP